MVRRGGIAARLSRLSASEIAHFLGWVSMASHRTDRRKRYRTRSTRTACQPRRTTLRARHVRVQGVCRYQREADLQGLIDTGRGDVPLIRLRFRCSNCGSRLTDWVVTAKNTGPRA